MAKKTQSLSMLKRKEAIAGYLFLLPSAVGFLIFVAFPIIYGLYLCFTESDAINPPKWIGLANFARMFKDPLIGKALKNNFAYTFLVIPGTAGLGLLLAILLHSKIKLAETFKTLLFFPYITSSIAVSLIWKQLYHPQSGLINATLRGLGFENVPGWLSSTTHALYAIVIVVIWHNCGYNMVIFLAGLQSIPYELYEAGYLEGATGWKKFRYITFPLLSPTIFFVVTMGIINSFKVFDMIYQMTLGGPGNATTVLVYRIFEEGIINMRFGYASAIALLLFFIILIFTIIQFVLQKVWVFYAE